MPQWFTDLIDFLLRLFGIRVDPAQQPTVKPETKPEATILPEYRKSNSLMTFQERKFYRSVLMEELGSEFTIFSKVRLGDLIWIANEPTDKKQFSNQIHCKHIDFVLCNRGTLEPLLALELDDSSHDNYDRQESDNVKNRVCEAAHLPLKRVVVKGEYATEVIAEEIRAMIRNQHLVN